MSLNIRILLAFAVMAILVATIAFLGLSASRVSNLALREVVDLDLPAEEKLGRIGSYFQSMTAEKNFILNQNLDWTAHQNGHARYAEARTGLLETISSFDETVRQLAGGREAPEAREFLAAWSALKSALEEWIKTSDQVFGLYEEWEATSILNPNLLWGSMQLYRGDHYLLVRRMAEMALTGQASGPEVTHLDNLCAFGQWRESFDAGQELFSQNQAMATAMRDITDPHKAFHEAAGKLYDMIKNGQGGDLERDNLLKELYSEADYVVGGFSGMITELEKAQAIYRSADNLGQGKWEEQRLNCLDLLSKTTAAKVSFDAWDKGLVIEGGQRNLRVMTWGTGAALLLSVILAVLVALSIKRRLTGPLNMVIDELSVDADELASVSGQISQSSAALSEGAADQAASLEESSTAVEELSSMTSRNAESSRQASVMMTENAGQVAAGHQTVAKMSEAMGAISQSSQAIGNIIKSIEGIAFQTNLLALNAAVEAARAGDAGQGFAVVADEVRNLAQRSAQAAQETRGLIEDTVHRVDAGQKLTQDIRDFFDRLSQSTSQVLQQINDIDQASGEQAQGMQQINQSMTRIDKVAQDSLNNAQNSARASEALSGRAAGLVKAVEELRCIVGRQKGADCLDQPEPAAR